MNLVFLPGASGSTEFWQPVQTRLDSSHQTRVISYPSFGGYAAHVDVNSMQDLQAHVINQINEPCVLIAQSMGGIFAVQATLKKPDLIQSLVLVATSGGIDLKNFKLKDWSEEYQDHYAVPHWFMQDQTKLDHLLHHIQCPVLLIWGGEDEISPVAVGEYISSKFKNAELNIIPQGQHHLAKQYPDQCSVLIHDFLAKIE